MDKKKYSTIGIILNFPANNAFGCQNNCNQCLFKQLNYKYNIKPDITAIIETTNTYLADDGHILLYPLAGLYNIDVDYIEQILNTFETVDIILCVADLVPQHIELLSKFNTIYVGTENIDLSSTSLNIQPVSSIALIDKSILYLKNTEIFVGKQLEKNLLKDLHIDLNYTAKPRYVESDNNFSKFAVDYFVVGKHIDEGAGKISVNLLYYYDYSKNLLSSPKSLAREEEYGVEDE